jgi:hypothetical protein
MSIREMYAHGYNAFFEVPPTGNKALMSAPRKLRIIPSKTMFRQYAVGVRGRACLGEAPLSLSLRLDSELDLFRPLIVAAPTILVRVRVISRGESQAPSLMQIRLD